MGEYRQDSGFKECASHIDDVDASLKFYEKLCAAIALLAVFACILCAYYFRTYENSGIDSIKSYYYISEDVSLLNSATVEELMSISGIGEKKAHAIVDYREAIGGFTNYGQLLDVDGISDKLADKIMEYYYKEGYNPFRDGDATLADEDLQ